MVAVLYAVISMIVVLGIMIVIHELGHFIAAKSFGVRVEAFSVGFGKPLLSFKRGDTEYRLSALPLGGYVKMSGETPQDETTGDPGEFTAHPRWQRLIIAAAGPFMNVVLAVVLITVIGTFHHERDYALDEPSVVGYVMPGTPAEAAGIKAGDLIVAAGNHATPQWRYLYTLVSASAGRPLDILYQRDGRMQHTTLTPVAVGKEGDAGWDAARPLIITDFDQPDLPAQLAGIRVGDEVVSVNGQHFHHIVELNQLLQKNGTTPVQFVVRRGAQTLSYTIKPISFTDDEGHNSYRIGFVSQPSKVDRLPVGQAFVQALTICRRGSVMIFDLVGQMIERKASIKQFSGPITIARMSGETAHHKAWYDDLWLMAIISLNLGIFNLFPVPILDGGMILLLAIEGILRRDINLVIKERIYQAAFVCLVLFAGVVIYNDILKALPGIARHFQ